MFPPAAPRLRACSARLGGSAILRSRPRTGCLRISPVARASLRAGFSTAPSDGERDTLREVFDRPPASSSWFTSLLTGDASNRANAGLFKNRYLTKPEGFHVFAHRNLERASVLVGKVLNASSLDEYRAVVKDLDRLSDLLCRVLDLCDFVRMTHPDPGFQDAATDAWMMVYQYMNQLNSTTGLNDQLRKAMENPDVTSTWTEEEMIVAKTLRVDFEKSAIHLPEKIRDRFVTMSQEISTAGTSFVEGMAPAKAYFEVHNGSYDRAPSDVRRKLNQSRISRHGSVSRISSFGDATALAQKKFNSEDIRKSAYLAANTASPRAVGSLESMLRLRSEVASLTGFESYGHQHLQDRMMAKSPAAVMQFLKALHKNNVPVVEKELADLLAAKRAALGEHHTEVLAWDSEFCKHNVRLSMTLAERKSRAQYYPSDKLSSYFSLGTLIEGLSTLFNRLYGIRFVPREALPGEVWHPDVRRLDVLSEKGDLIAVLYCDLYYRAGKSPNPAHYTVRCSRDILDDEIAEVSRDMGPLSFESPEASSNDGMEAVREGGVLKQLPTVVLVCDFARRPCGRPTLLDWRDIETLFHEMGHAVHSILARTSFQNVAGTRCATDLAELPSTLMEHFASDPTVVGLFARHWQTGEKLPYEQIASRVALTRRFEGLDTERQIILAMFDQACHSAAGGAPEFDSTALYHQIQAEYATGPRDDPSTSWQGFFGHLFGYGSTYYSYLFDRVLAERVWQVLFKGGEGGAAVSRENGERLKENLLRWGGGRDPWRCMADTLQDERIAGGGEAAMGIVGNWGIQKHVEAR